VPHTENHLIAKRPSQACHLLRASCERVDRALEEGVCEAGQVARHDCFAIHGFVLLVALMDSHPELDVGMVGREGVLGAPPGPGRADRAVAVAGAGCWLHHHLVGPRLARCQFISQHRARAHHCHATHEFLACTPRIRRVGVTVAAGVLQHQNLITDRSGAVRSSIGSLSTEAAPC
jgi:hypothetical protein